MQQIKQAQLIFPYERLEFLGSKEIKRARKSSSNTLIIASATSIE